jgi:hypothetical protein
MEMKYELELGKCDIVDHSSYINQKKCEILKKIITNKIYDIPKEVIDTWKYFNYEFGLVRETQCIESLVIFNGFTNELDYFYYSPIPVILLYGDYEGIEKFIKKIEPFIKKDLEKDTTTDNE